MLRAVANMVGGGFAGSFTTLTVSGQASFADGTAAAPSVKIGDEQNGLYSSAANTLDVSCGGFQQFQFAYTANAANYWAATGAISTGGVRIDTAGVDSGVNGFFVTKGSGVWNFCTGSSSGNRQYQILHTAGSTRWVTATGSNGGSPTIGTSAGDLAFSTNIGVTGYIAGSEQTAPSAPSANGYRIFAQDNGAGKTQLMVIFASGAAQQLAIEP